MSSVFRGLRGWGGVAAMGAACALTAGGLTLLPMSTTAAGARQVPATATRVSDSRAAASDPVDDNTKCEASLPPSATASGPALRAIRKRGFVRIGVDQNSYRWGYRDPVTGQIQGFDIDLARAIAASIFHDTSPDRIVFVAVSTGQRIPDLNSGAVDMVVRTMSIECDRRGQVAFSTGYFRAGQQVLAPKDSGITGLDDSLKGKRVCTAQGSTAAALLDRDPHGAVFVDRGKPVSRAAARIEDDLSVPNQLDCLVRLQLGKVDAVVTDNSLGAGLAAQDSSVELKGEPVDLEDYGVAVKLGNDDLVRQVNHALEQYRAGGEDSAWKKSYDHWLKAEDLGITGPPAPVYTSGR
jgi:polar amino acid transport system substrate-binding protein